MPHSELTALSPVALVAELEQKYILPCIRLWEETAPLLPQAASALTDLQYSLYKKLIDELSHFATFRKMHFYAFLLNLEEWQLVQLRAAQCEELDSYLQDVKLQHQRLRDYFYRCGQVAPPLYESESPAYMFLRSRLLELKKLTDEWIFREEAELLPQLLSLK